MLVDGRVVYACEEERLNREKKSRKFPIQAVRDGLARSGMTLEDVDVVALSVNAGIYLEHLDTVHSERLRYRGEMLYSTPAYLISLLKDDTSTATRQQFEFAHGSKLSLDWIEHHIAHAASTFYLSPYDRAAILTMDGFGEKACGLFGRGRDHKIDVLYRQDFPHSLGSFYAAMTELLGFQPYSDEWKVMGAAPYGTPDRFLSKLRDLFKLNDDGSYEMDLSYFNYYQFHRPGMYAPKLLTYLGVKPNEEEVELQDVYYDLAAATQKVTEEVYFFLLRRLHAMTGEKSVCLAGGVAFNSVANGKVVAETPFESVFIPPIPDDSGTSLGAALYVHHHVQGHPRMAPMVSNYLGPGYSNEEIEETLDRFHVPHQRLDHPATTAAEMIAGGKIIGWLQGRLEFGDRALGNRSILADPRRAEMKDKVNATIKYRERFRPFAPSILAERMADYFLDAAPTPFMEKVFLIRPEKRSEIPAVTHEDGTGRLQTVSREQNPLYYELIQQFEKRTNVPVVLNTSFNLKGEPIVCSPQDAIRTFFSSGLDGLIMGNSLVVK